MDWYCDYLNGKKANFQLDSHLGRLIGEATPRKRDKFVSYESKDLLIHKYPLKDLPTALSYSHIKWEKVRHMSQQDMFSHEEIDPSVLRHITEQPEDSAIWPTTLLELFGVIDSKLDDKAQSLEVVLAIGELMGGMQFYLPRGDKLHQHIRDMEIYNEFNGRNIPELVKKYRLTNKAIYEVVARMRQAETKRRQFSLFE